MKVAKANSFVTPPPHDTILTAGGLCQSFSENQQSFHKEKTFVIFLVVLLIRLTGYLVNNSPDILLVCVKYVTCPFCMFLVQHYPCSNVMPDNDDNVSRAQAHNTIVYVYLYVYHYGIFIYFFIFSCISGCIQVFV